MDDYSLPRVDETGRLVHPGAPEPQSPPRNLTPIVVAVAFVVLVAGLLIAGASISWKYGLVFVDFASAAPCSTPADKNCLEATADVATAYDDPNACLRSAEPQVCLVPLGATDLGVLVHIKERLQTDLGLPVQVLPPLTLGDIVIDADRQQLNADLVMRFVEQLYAERAGEPGSLLLAITPMDIFLPSMPDWNWAFGQRHKLQNGVTSGVISTNRMVTPDIRVLPSILPVDFALGLSDGTEYVDDRAYKMALKYVAISYLGYALSDDPDSVLFNTIRSASDLDRMSDHLPADSTP